MASAPSPQPWTPGPIEILQLIDSELNAYRDDERKSSGQTLLNIRNLMNRVDWAALRNAEGKTNA